MEMTNPKTSSDDGTATRERGNSKYDSPFARRPGSSVRWSGLSYEVKTKKEPFQVLNSVWGEAPGGKVTCILGPSGAGKSSLLNVLAGRVSVNSENSIHGSITVNETPIHPVKYRKNIAYVMQEDHLFMTLTPREALRFSAALRIPKSVDKVTKQELVETMLKELNLLQCADTLIGGPLIKGISGGEKKRTSIGMELVTNPSLVFLDEPTSGLDSYSANTCIQLLQKVAAAGSAVLCTIHQPSSEIFEMFDTCILMKSGYIVYNGPVGHALYAHFDGCGLSVPAHYNPADHLLTVVQTQTIEDLRSKNVVMASPKDGTPTDSYTLSSKGHYVRNGVWIELQWLVWREMLALRRDYGALAGRFGLTIFLGVIIGLIFEGAGNRDDSLPENIATHQGAITFIAINAMFGTAQASLFAFPLERPIFLREYSTGTYSPSAYFFAKIASELPLTFAQNLVLVLITYFTMGLDGFFLSIVCILWALGLASTSFAMILGSLADDAQKAVEMAPALFVPQILFAGFFIRIEQVPVFLRWAQWVCSLKYAMNLLIIAEFSDCDASAEENCEEIFVLNDVEEDDWWAYILFLAALFVVFRALGLFFLTKKAQKFY